MRSSFGLTLGFSALLIGAACSGSSGSAAPGSAGAAGSSAAGASGSGGGETGAGSSQAQGGAMAGSGASAGDSSMAGDSSSATGGHFGTCPSLGEPLFGLFGRFGCGQCALNDCNAELTEAFGQNWSGGDVTSAGDCSDYMMCVASCQCNATCASNCSISASCQVAKNASEACVSMDCYIPCGGGLGSAGAAGGFDEGPMGLGGNQM